MNIIPFRRTHELGKSRTDRRDMWDRLDSHLPEVFQRGLSPALDVAETEDAWHVSLELPGLDEKDIDIQLMGNQLVISGERTWTEDKQEKTFHRVESQYGSFRRAVTLPANIDVDPERIEASYEKGVLTIDVPKPQPTPSSKIPIKA